MKEQMTQNTNEAPVSPTPEADAMTSARRAADTGVSARQTADAGASSFSEVEGPGYIRRSSIRSWFQTFMIMNIPIAGWFYLLYLAVSKRSDQRKDFAKAYLIYKLVFLLVALAILAILMYVGLDAADKVLRYMDML